jgi:hypothetical protein
MTSSLELDCLQTSPAKTIAIIFTDKSLLLVREGYPIALTFKDIAHLTFEGSLAAATMFGFVLTHAVI